MEGINYTQYQLMPQSHTRDSAGLQLDLRQADNNKEHLFGKNQAMDASMLTDNSRHLTDYQMQQTGYAALRDFLRYNGECEKAKKRVRILQKQEEHYQSMLVNQQKSQEHMQSIRKEKQNHHNMKKQAKHDQLLYRRSMGQINQNLREERQKKIHQVFSQISEMKAEEYRTIKEQSKYYAHLRQKRQQGDLKDKRDRRNIIIEGEFACRYTQQLALQEKRQLAKSRNNVEISLFQQQQNQKKKQCEVMSDIETEILQKSQVTKQQINRNRIGEISHPKKQGYSHYQDSLTPENKDLLHEFSIRMNQGQPGQIGHEHKKNQSWDLRKIYQSVFNHKNHGTN